jgi:hypothetical protein
VRECVILPSRDQAALAPRERTIKPGRGPNGRTARTRFLVAERVCHASRNKVLKRYSPILCLFALMVPVGPAALAQSQGLSTRPPVAHVQGPRIGLIEFFGLSKTSEVRVRQALGVREGDFLPRSKGDAEERIDAVAGIVESHLEAVCCEGANMILYIGVEEKGAKHFDLRATPDGDVTLPDDITKLYHRFLDASEKAARFTAAEDLTTGRALSGDKDVRDLQEQFIPVADRYLPDLRRVLHDASDEEQRAMAAYVIAYATDQKNIVDDLQYAVKDSDAGVRANATRGLKALAVFAHLNANSGVSVEPTWFIEMLNSLSFADRMQAMAMLQILTDNRGESAIGQLRDRAINSLVEMARWKSLKNALPAFVLVGRLTPLTDAEVQDAWTRGDRESVIAQALASVKKKK